MPKGRGKEKGTTPGMVPLLVQGSRLRPLCGGQRLPTDMHGHYHMDEIFVAHGPEDAGAGGGARL
jgi:hypothetical protein